MIGFQVSQVPKIKKLLFLILATLLPFVFTISWLIKNSQLPVSDATDYLKTAFLTYRYFTEHSFLSHLLHFEMPRGWRPIFFPVLIAPFVFLYKGNMFLAYSAVAALCLVVSTIYIYLILRLKLDRFSAIVASNSIGLLPFIQNPILAFFSESALFPCIIGCVYHLIKSDYLRNKSHTIAFTLLLTLALLIRPVEAILHLSLVLSLFIILGFKQRIFSKKQIIQAITICLLSIFIFFFLVATHYINHYPLQVIDAGGFFDKKLAKTIYKAVIVSFICAAASTLIVLFLSNRKQQEIDGSHKRPPLNLVFISTILVVFAWYLPHAFHTFLWIFRTSIGDIASNSSTWINQSFWQGLSNFISEEGKDIVAGVVLTGLLGAIFISKQQKIATLTSMPFIYLMLLIPIPIWEVFFTVQGTSRKLSIALPAFLIAILMLGLQQGRLWLIRIAIIFTVLLFQFYHAMSSLYGNAHLTFNAAFGSYQKPVTTTPNPHDVVMQFLIEQQKRNYFKNVAIEVNADQAYLVDPFLLIMMSEISGLNFKVIYPYFSKDSIDNIQKMHKNTDAIFLADKLDIMQVSDDAAKGYAIKYQAEKNATTKIWYQLLLTYSGNKLTDINWKLGPCLVVKGVDENDYQGCLLFRSKQLNDN